MCPRTAVALSLGTGGLARVAPAVPAPPRVLSCVTSAPSLLLVALSLLCEAQALLQQGFQCFCFVTWEGVLPSGFYSLIFHGLGWCFINLLKSVYFLCSWKYILNQVQLECFSLSTQIPSVCHNYRICWFLL